MLDHRLHARLLEILEEDFLAILPVGGVRFYPIEMSFQCTSCGLHRGGLAATRSTLVASITCISSGLERA